MSLVRLFRAVRHVGVSEAGNVTLMITTNDGELTLFRESRVARRTGKTGTSTKAKGQSSVQIHWRRVVSRGQHECDNE